MEDSNMTRRVLRGSILKKSLIIVSFMLGSASVQTPLALAQHGGHPGVGGAHAVSPPISPVPILHPPIRPRVSSAPPVAAFRAGGLIFRPHPMRPFPPVFPLHGAPIFFSGPFWRYWAGWGYNSCWWTSCYLFWNWGFGYNTLPFYEYGPENYVLPQIYEYPVYLYGESRRELPQLYLKDGTVYRVTDYWLVDNQLHFTTIEAGDTKSVEHVIGFDELDLQATIDRNTQRGFRFVLRNEPVEQYLRDHPDQTPPIWPSPKD
jgi:hypothetical protein